MKENELHSCPHCGAPGEVVEIFEGLWMPQCSKACVGPAHFEGKEGAIKRWNRRVEPDVST